MNKWIWDPQYVEIDGGFTAYEIPNRETLTMNISEIIKRHDHIDGMLSDIHYWLISLEESNLEMDLERMGSVTQTIQNYTALLYERIEKIADQENAQKGKDKIPHPNQGKLL